MRGIIKGLVFGVVLLLGVGGFFVREVVAQSELCNCTIVGDRVGIVSGITDLSQCFDQTLSDGRIITDCVWNSQAYCLIYAIDDTPIFEHTLSTQTDEMKFEIAEFYRNITSNPFYYGKVVTKNPKAPLVDINTYEVGCYKRPVGSLCTGQLDGSTVSQYQVLCTNPLIEGDGCSSIYEMRAVFEKPISNANDSVMCGDGMWVSDRSKAHCINDKNIAQCLAEFQRSHQGDAITCYDFDGKQSSCLNTEGCYWFGVENKCVKRTDRIDCSKITIPQECGGSGTGNRTIACQWSEVDNRCLSTVEYDSALGREGSSGDILPPCAARGTCRDVNDLLQLAVNVAKEAFKYLGMLAFVMFVAGGFTMVLSFGNAEKFKKGQGILVAAVIGIAIAFSAYIIIDFILDALNVSSGFREIN